MNTVTLWKQSVASEAVYKNNEIDLFVGMGGVLRMHFG